MTTYDWIVIGGGIAGSALGYELAKAGGSVLLIEQSAEPANGTRYSYGGIAYWSGNTELLRQVCQDGIDLHRSLSAELEADTQFRELDLLMVIAPDADGVAIAQTYKDCLVVPTLITAETACEMEPLLSRDAIGAALHVRHGHVNPEQTADAYRQALTRLGGTVQIARLDEWVMAGNCVQGVVTSDGTYMAANVVVCAGAWSRNLLKAAGLVVPIYYTQAELLETLPLELQMRSLVMLAQLKRFAMEAVAVSADAQPRWDEPLHELAPPILDEGAVQFQDGRMRIGQISRVLTDPDAVADPASSEAAIRSGVGHFLPALQDVPGTWRSCAIAFSGDRLPLIGAVPGAAGLHIFSGFSNPFALLPPLARRYAQHLSGATDDLVIQCSPTRFQP